MYPPFILMHILCSQKWISISIFVNIYIEHNVIDFLYSIYIKYFITIFSCVKVYYDNLQYTVNLFFQLFLYQFHYYRHI